jgi:uncharacterized protein (DUF488 family)
LLLFTIGHSNHSFERFLGLLRRHEVEAAADVRSRPYSRFVPHFSKDRLQRLLAENGIGYHYLGAELGGKPVSGATSASGMDYRSRVAAPGFQRGIEGLLAVAREQRIAMMCRERDPLECHRLHLICRYLGPMALDIRHILPGGELESQAAAEERLVERAGAPGLPLFRDGAQPPSPEALERAYDAWWRRGR